MLSERADAKLGAETEDGYIVATITRERGYFSVTGEIHNSRRAFELGTGNPHSCGCIHDEILRAFPQLAPIVAMHLADVQTGEPMHAANGWHWLDKGDDDAAAHALNCDPDELSIFWDRADFDAFVNDVLRPRWQSMADEANRLIDGMESTASEPEPTDEERFAVTLDAGLKLSATLMDEEGYRNGVGSFYQYKVTIRAPGASYTATFGASVADYQAGVRNAREAAFGTARELLMFEHESARGFIEDSCGESWEDLPAEQRRALTRAEKAFDRMEDALIANRETLGG